ncbi:hypothetical protein Clacol_003878 [Clathrus columnatus]|uniref:BZIP domain-containing protein n=1 Tax=Clathrus columnatus TaxID=1419009 RepID=A0AAV5AAA2_9AGAM|nr:hypothetical protein Clacol_003878 [Clathrus columnatus]
MSSAVASSSTLWAQASKEWIIPAKPKPGRKPKKDPTALAPVDEITEPDSKGRRVQNRAAQRAFRERKQSQLADLQARVQLYEQGEMERNVALQNIAKRLKEENESLRKENTALREELKKLRPDRSSSVETERKRWREESLIPYSHADLTSRKRFKTDSLSDLSPDSLPSTSLSLMTSPASIASSPGSDSTSSSVQNDSYSPVPFSTRSPNPPMYSQTQHPPMNSLYASFQGKHPACMNENRTASSFDPPFDMVDCGFCSDDTPCMCRELALQHVTRIAIHNEVPGTGPTIPTNSSSAGPMGAQSPPEVKMESRGSLSINSTPQMTPVPVPIAPMSSILDNLPAYSPPIPLPRRRTADHPPPSIFPVYPAQSLTLNRSLRQNRSTSPNCTGDPSNCLACSDDPFGKAFCAALGSSIKECNNCPNNEPAFETGFVGCGGCGNPNLCGGAGSNLNSNPPQSSSALGGESNTQASSSNHMSNSSSQTMSCNTAWAQLKSHPNIAFADLTLLANVVARRSKCTGPRVVLSPDPELDALSARRSGRSLDDRGSDDMSVLLTDPHAQYHDRPDSIISRPTEMMIQCGRQRVVEVNAEGVQDALALLDGQFQRS